MHRSFRHLLATTAIALFVAALGMGVLGAGGSGSRDLSSALASVHAFAAPLLNWSNPQNVTNSTDEDAAPVVAAAPNGAVTIAWERRSDQTYVMQRSNTTLNGVFGNAQQLDVGASNEQNRNIHVVADSQGRRHILWWTNSGGSTHDAYALVDTNGIGHTQAVPFTCPDVGCKNIALAIGASGDDSLHMLYGHDLNNIYYAHMTSGGTWDIQNELVTDINSPKNIAIGVSSVGQVMAAWISNGNVTYSTRQGPNSWSSPQALTGTPLCGGNSHGPSLARDSSGGLRLAYSQACPTAGEILYREWTPGGGWGSASSYANPSDQNAGDSAAPSITVDSSGVAHIVWSDDTGRPSSHYQTFYSSGTLSSGFSTPTAIFQSYISDDQKDPSIAQNPPGSGVSGYLHSSFSSVATGNKEDYYSNAPLANATPCVPGSYSDVHQSDYYYTATQELGTTNPPIMSGYSDCTFHPELNITRGQTAKIVILGAGLTINTNGGPHFSDVPQSNPFYSYIETAYNANPRIINGYSDGTFHPGDNVTRAQFSKMAVLAFRIPINTNGGPHFSDVPVTDAFYSVIETAYNRGLISGYAGGLFKPSDNLLRGQAAKIVYLARH